MKESLPQEKVSIEEVEKLQEKMKKQIEENKLAEQEKRIKAEVENISEEQALKRSVAIYRRASLNHGIVIPESQMMLDIMSKKFESVQDMIQKENEKRAKAGNKNGQDQRSKRGMPR